MTLTMGKTGGIAAVPAELHSGDRMTQAEFHRVYAQMPEDFRAELIGGIVYLASPLGLRHGKSHQSLGALLLAYEAQTPGTESSDNTTVILGEEGEPQPDLFLRVLPEFGGQSRTTEGDYVEGPPEFIAEIAHSSRAIDLHRKRADYQRYGVKEYLVLSVGDGHFYWFDLPADHELSPDPDGILRARAFPGLWIDADAVIARDYRRAMATLGQGLATAEHAAFVKELAARAGRAEPPAPAPPPLS